MRGDGACRGVGRRGAGRAGADPGAGRGGRVCAPGRTRARVALRHSGRAGRRGRGDGGGAVPAGVRAQRTGGALPGRGQGGARPSAGDR